MPDIRGSILFLEDDLEAHVATIDRDLQSLIHQSGFEEVRGIVF
jgi:muramoyltetrapeptide carboxypeptidase